MSIFRRVLVVLGLSRLNRANKVKQGKAVHLAMTADPVLYPVLTYGALMATLLLKTDALAAADSATVTGGSPTFDAADIAEDEYDTAIRAIGAALQTNANANPVMAEEIIHGAALKSKRAPVSRVDPQPVDAVEAKVTGLGTVIKLLLLSINPYGTQYEIQMTTTPDVEASWQTLANITAKRYTVTGLENGTRYYFRVCALNSLGKTIFTNEVSQVAA